MAAKIISALVTLLINIAAGVVIFFMMLVAMNGFSGSDAEYGLVTYVVLAGLTSISMSIGALFLVHFLLKKQFSCTRSILIAVPIFVIAGVVLKIIACLIGIGVAEHVRVNY